MKSGRLVCAKAGSTLLALGVLVGSAVAGTPGKCQSDPPANTCDQAGYCGHTGLDPMMPCFVRVSETGGAATVTAENVTGGPGSAEYICVNADTEILWFTLEEKSKFEVVFGVPHPFVDKSAGKEVKFDGQKGKASSDEAKGLPKDACYQYSVKHCIKKKCTPVLDPKVIVKGGSVATSDAAKPKPMGQ
jgi:hypothetical protein